MRVRVRAFGDYELRPRPRAGEVPSGRLVRLDARTVDRLLRSALAEFGPHRLRALLNRDSARGRVLDELGALAELRRAIERGDLVFVAIPPRGPSTRPIEVEEPEPYEPAGPEEIVDSVDWIEILIADEDDQPVANVAFEIELPDGSKRRGRTNADGIARCDGIPTGNCRVTLTELDTNAWAVS